MAGPAAFVADLQAESDDLDALVAPLPAEGWADHDTRAGLDHRTPDRAPAVDRPGVAALSHRRGRVRRSAGRRGSRSRGLRRRRRRRTRRDVAGRVACRLARHSAAATRGAARGSRRPQIAVVRAADERGVDGHGAIDGDLGARTRRGRRSRCHPARRPIGCARSRIIGVRTRDYAFFVNNLAPPSEPFLVELRGPGGDTWSWGPSDAAQRVTGSAEDFCYLVTQRRAPGCAGCRRRWGRTRSAGWRSLRPSRARPDPGDERALGAARCAPSRTVAPERRGSLHTRQRVLTRGARIAVDDDAGARHPSFSDSPPLPRANMPAGVIGIGAHHSG